MGDSRGHIPKGQWEFDEKVTECFEDMLERSIPQYQVMRAAVLAIGARYVQPRTHIVDLGASRGSAIDPFIKRFGAANQYTAVEISEPMLNTLRERFKGWTDSGMVEVLDSDLRHEFPPAQASLILSVFTLQFIPIEYRQQLVRQIYEHLAPGGALIVVEKILGDTAELDEVLVEEYLAFKAKSGYSQDEIDRKRLSLEGVLVPLTAEWNETLLKRCGFQQADCFWRWMNFAAWVAVK